ncbi:MAG: amino acid ABC transporter substrate-binding protein [Chlorogloeopsis fritschii C42_A2020_084]|uniref:ABC transporter substrate-binding protein n=1 Tax=Chlorogloeopsis fritschii TaxID=1124 RepID=UPI0019F7A5C7|nr:ABC transporter substrate-binding protein [Chlorogloeopsis fritschii]MBF2008678.1 amino acid ABC transporter substrate-binding protein [Chlorogloeopsis fritschii C42_A2020_084]
MSSGNQDPIYVIFRTGRLIFRRIARLWRQKQYLLLAFLLSVTYWFLFRPKDGWLSSYLFGDSDSSEYKTRFSSILVVILFLGFVLEVFKRIIQRTSLHRLLVSSSLVILIAIITISLLEISTLPPPNNRLACSKGDCISWGENILIEQKYFNGNEPWQKECSSSSRLKEQGRLEYENKQEDKQSEIKSALNDFLEKCKNDAEAHIYLNNIDAWRNKNPIRVVVSVPISRNGGDTDSQEILRGVALAQYQVNQSKKGINGKKLLIGIADDGYEIKKNTKSIYRMFHSKAFS